MPHGLCTAKAVIGTKKADMTELIRRTPHVPYAELHAHSAYSFLDGASLPEELVARAQELELEALALTDHAGFPGVVQLAEAARAVGMPTVIGTELTIAPHGLGERAGVPDPAGEHIVLLARDTEGYALLSRTIGKAMLASGKKGQARFTIEELGEAGQGRWLALTGCRKGGVRQSLGQYPWDISQARRELDRLIAAFGHDNVAVELTIEGNPLDRERCVLLTELAREARVEAIATGNVHYARPRDRAVADVLAATRARRTLSEIDPYLPSSGRYLRSGAHMAALHCDYPRAVEVAARIGTECAFDLALVAPQLPPFPVPAGYTEATWLRELTEQRGNERYGSRGKNPAAWAMIDHEMDIIVGLGFPGYFLIVEEIVSFCRENGIWCQGRGSAANSAVCFALGITPVDAITHRMLFERFLSPDRSGPPDIDLDIESGRREEVIQHVYDRYGRECAAQVANSITYRPRSAIRDAARAFGYEPGQADRWSKSLEHRVPRDKGRTPDPTKERNAAEDAAFYAQHGRSASFTQRWDMDVLPEDVATIAAEMQKLPRHLGIHSGGMVLCDRPVIDVCPVGWASKPGRTVLQWDKDDCAEAGLVKFDLLGLGMLTALRVAFTELAGRGILGENGQPLGLYNLPQEDSRVYDLLTAADTIGVFQVESRAQMATLPRLRPEKFYDIVIEVALIRPGPIQGQSVSPYINRKNGREKVTYLHPLLEPALKRTMGVPLFQEQLMQIAIDVAGFTPAQADRLRKAMGSKRSHARMGALRDELFAGMASKGIGEDVAQEIYDKLQAFAEFGFPESHSYSFAYLVYASAWLKVHYPEEFYAGILASQPMGFYSPQSLVADARRHSVLVLRPDVNSSQELASVQETEERTLTPHALVDASPRRAVRLGLASVRGLGKASDRIIGARAEGPFTDLQDLSRRARLTRQDVEALASAGALESLGVDRRTGIWVADAVADRSHTVTVPGSGARRPSTFNTGPHRSTMNPGMAVIPGTDSMGLGPSVGNAGNTNPEMSIVPGINTMNSGTSMTRNSGTGMTSPSAEDRDSPRWFQPTIPGTEACADIPDLPRMTEAETTDVDVRATGVSPFAYPTQFLRPRLDERGIYRVADLMDVEAGKRVEVAGIVTHRQRPHTAKGVTFLSVEDETGLLNVVCSHGLWQRHRDIARRSGALIVRGMVERGDGAMNFVADFLSVLPLNVTLPSRDFR